MSGLGYSYTRRAAAKGCW